MENVDNDEILAIINEIKILFKENRYNNDSIEDFKKDNLDEIENLEEALHNFMGENDLKILKTECPDFKWKNSTKKLAYPHEYLISLDDYKKHDNNLKKEGFFTNLKNKCTDYEKIERTVELIKKSISKMGKN